MEPTVVFDRNLCAATQSNVGRARVGGRGISLGSLIPGGGFRQVWELLEEGGGFGGLQTQLCPLFRFLPSMSRSSSSPLHSASSFSHSASSPEIPESNEQRRKRRRLEVEISRLQQENDYVSLEQVGRGGTGVAWDRSLVLRCLIPSLTEEGEFGDVLRLCRLGVRRLLLLLLNGLVNGALGGFLH